MKNIFSWGGASFIVAIFLIINIFIPLPFLNHGLYHIQSFSIRIVITVAPLVLVIISLLSIISIIKEQGMKRRLGIIALIMGALYLLFALFTM